MALENGVKDYLKTQAIVEVNFPIDFGGRVYTACRYCQYLSANERVCQLNKQPVAFPSNYVGASCPLIEKEDKDGV